MDTQTSTTPGLAPQLKSATRLTPLQLNAIRLDVRHTILTPDYLESLASGESE